MELAEIQQALLELDAAMVHVHKKAKLPDAGEAVPSLFASFKEMVGLLIADSGAGNQEGTALMQELIASVATFGEGAGAMQAPVINPAACLDVKFKEVMQETVATDFVGNHSGTEMVKNIIETVPTCGVS